MSCCQARPRHHRGRYRLGQVHHAGGDGRLRNEKTRGHIVTIEDPVEYVHPTRLRDHHREVGVDTDSWHAALKNTLRQAPDVILIGEIRDRETMEYGIQFAETGHLVLATLHANSSTRRWTASSISSPRSGASSF